MLPGGRDNVDYICYVLVKGFIKEYFGLKYLFLVTSFLLMSSNLFSESLKVILESANCLSRLSMVSSLDDTCNMTITDDNHYNGHDDKCDTDNNVDCDPVFKQMRMRTAITM